MDLVTLIVNDWLMMFLIKKKERLDEAFVFFYFKHVQTMYTGLMHKVGFDQFDMLRHLQSLLYTQYVLGQIKMNCQNGNNRT